MTDEAPGVAGLRILLVEDEALVAMMIEDMLRDLGCTVVGIAGSVSEGLAFVENAALDLDGAVLDVNLGGEKVFPVAEGLRGRGVPFIFSTGYGKVGIVAEFAGTPILAKPYGALALRGMLAASVA